MDNLKLLIPFGVACIASIAFIPAVRWYSFKTGRVAKPRPDRWHRQPTPKLGGVGMFLAFAVGLVIAQVLEGQGLTIHWSLLAGSAVMFGLGLYDDFRPVTPPVKLMVQILAATVVIFFGDYLIHFFRWPIANILLTFFWLVGITNAINLLDNMDALAGGVAFFAACFLSYFSWRSNDQATLVLSLSLAGSILGFLIFNFPPARIFMGDSGSMFLGFTLASLAVARRTQASNVFAILGVPSLIFLLPILDTSLVMVTRILRGQSPAQGGTDHTSHRLIAFGLNERQAVLVLYGVALVSGLAGAALEALSYDLSLVLIPILLIVLSLFVAYLGRLKVVTTYTPVQGNITRIMSDLTYKRRLFEMALDLMLIGVSYYLAYWTRFGLGMTTLSMTLFLQSWPLTLANAYLSFFIFGVYRGVWRYVGLEDLARYFKAALGAVIPSAGLLVLLHPRLSFSFDVFILYGVFLFLGLAGSRFSFQILDRVFTFQRAQQDKKNVLLFGAQDSGELALRWLLRNPDVDFKPVGVLDEDVHLWGRSIHGVDILGGSQQLINILESKSIDGVIISSPDLLKNVETQKILAICRQKGVWTRVLRLELELIE